MELESELSLAGESVLRFVELAIQDALRGVTHETPGEVTEDVNQDQIDSLQKWAKKMYHHFPKESATIIVGFVDEVYTGSSKIVAGLVDRTIYDAVYSQTNTNITQTELRKQYSTNIKQELRSKSVEVARVLYELDEIRTIAQTHMEAALSRAQELTRVYLRRQQSDMMHGRLFTALDLPQKMHLLHQNAMNYFYRQVLSSLETEQHNARMKVQEKYACAYRGLMEEKKFSKNMKGWLQKTILPELVSVRKRSRPPLQRAMACF